MKSKTLLFTIVATGALNASAATSHAAPDISVIADNTYGGSLERLSDNGLWAVGWGKSLITAEAYSFPRLYDVKNNKTTYLFTNAEASSIGVMTANDVSNDGSIVVGCYNNLPAIWRASTGKWETVENKHSYKTGTIERVTPDGKYAIGTVNTNSGMYATIRMWDLSGTTPRDITPSNLPKPIGPNLTSTTGQLDALVQQLYAGDLSDDGTKFTGMVNFSYPDDTWSFVYDVTTDTWEGLGMDVTVDGNTYIFNRNTDGILYMNPGNFISGTNTLSGELYSTDDESGIFYYDLNTKEITVVPDASGYQFGAADTFGTVYASKSFGGPIRDWYFKTGNYWYDFSVVAAQLWDINWEEEYSHDDYGYTGTLTNVSNDGLTLIASDYSMSPYNSYVIRLDAPLSEIAKDVNLLGNYYVTPTNNASFANIREVKVTFDRDITVIGDYNAVNLTDATGNTIANSIALKTEAGDTRTLVATFRNRRMEEGELYKVVFPANIVCITNDEARTNSEISVTYKGRLAEPVKPISISPADGTEVTRINANSNPISIQFNSEISVLDDAPSMKLYLLGENNTRELIANLNGSIEGDMLSIYPLLEQRLAYGSNYEIEIAANTVADISGADPNEEILIHYVGSYVPESAGADGILFEDDFDQGLTNIWMYYDGASDLEPSDKMTSWGFQQGYPWWVVRESEESTDQSACTHSMFKEPGKADSWMVTSILNIKDETAFLSFKSQSYQDAGDVLKVYAYTTDDIYTVLTETIINNMRYYGDIIYEETETPGASEELLSGDWKETTISLAEYAGKNIYIAFVNDNRNKSAIFLDDVVIGIDVKFVMTNLTPDYGIMTDETEIKGLLEVTSLTETYNNYTIKVLDNDDNTLSSISDTNIEATRGWKTEFTMPAKLQTPEGKETKYKIEVTMNDVTETYNFSYRNLTHMTTKRVLLEEMTGQGCQACPLGHAAIDHILRDFPGLVLPIEIHTYTGDSFNNSRVQSLCTSLGLSSAPTARINRGSDIVSPMDTDASGSYVYKNAGLWYDYVVEELETMAPADIEITNIEVDGQQYTADIEVTFAIDMDNQNLNLLIELCEDNVFGEQYNFRYNVEDPALGEWGAGGKYGYLNVPYYFENVLRNWTGTTYNGTGGLIPSTIEAGKPYTTQMTVTGPKSITDPNTTHITVALIDSQTGKVLNANRTYTSGEASLDEIKSATETSVSVNGTTVIATCDGNFTVDAYNVMGTRIAHAQGSDSLTLDINNTGIIILNVSNSTGMKTYKLLVR